MAGALATVPFALLRPRRPPLAGRACCDCFSYEPASSSIRRSHSGLRPSARVALLGCQRALDLEDLGMTPIVAEVERRTGYQVDRHRLELFGLCPSCQSKPPS